jgi:hypothetical protein
VLVSVGLEKTPPRSDKGAREAQVAGRPSTVKYQGTGQSVGVPNRCVVTTLGRPLPSTDSVEMAEVTLMSPGTLNEQQICAVAQDVAADVWGNLPK